MKIAEDKIKMLQNEHQISEKFQKELNRQIKCQEHSTKENIKSSEKHSFIKSFDWFRCDIHWYPYLSLQ